MIAKILSKLKEFLPLDSNLIPNYIGADVTSVVLDFIGSQIKKVRSVARLAPKKSRRNLRASMCFMILLKI